ncbi:MAG: tRNA pseudouridine(38-40) synthase TruA [bacterium]
MTPTPTENSADHEPASPRHDGETVTRVRIDMAYLGTDFHGWQVQPQLRTVQGVLTEMIAKLVDLEGYPVGAGRTDAGVHARHQVCHLDTASPGEADRLRQKLPALAPVDLQVLNVRPVPASFDARFSACRRRYSYHLLWRRDVFRETTAVYVPGRLDREAMACGAEFFLGTHDCTSFCKRVSLHADGNECTLDVCRFDWFEDSAIFQVRANRFLHHMVRNMIGTLIEIGRGRREPEQIPAILAKRDRHHAGRKAPAKGLFLEEVQYPEELLDPDSRAAPKTVGGGPDINREGDTT